jgi:hypothetical protein
MGPDRITGTDKRQRGRTKAVLPVKVRGSDVSGKFFEELAHTLDVTAAGIRLGSIHHDLKATAPLTVWYRQRKIEFRVVWTRRLQGTTEYQVGLQATAQERDPWGLQVLDLRGQSSQSLTDRVVQAIGAV